MEAIPYHWKDQHRDARVKRLPQIWCEEHHDETKDLRPDAEKRNIWKKRGLIAKAALCTGSDHLLAAAVLAPTDGDPSDCTGKAGNRKEMCIDRAVRVERVKENDRPAGTDGNHDGMRRHAVLVDKGQRLRRHAHLCQRME